MDHTSPVADRPVRSIRLQAGPRLALVDPRVRLVHPAGDVPQAWRAALDGLLGWLGIAAEMAPAASLPDAPVFAPWIGWSPAAFQHDGLKDLPQAAFVVSYLVDHPRAAPPGRGGLDMMLMSPHPAQCLREEAGAVAVPGADVLAAMIRAARAQHRERLAIVVTARQRDAVTARVSAASEGLTGAAGRFDILTLEQALPPLMRARAPWDAIIAMPDLRSTVFTLLGHANAVGGAWPMLWFAGENGQELRLVTSEVAGGWSDQLPLDAPALILSLALALHAAGAERAALRLYEGWARLRDSGVTTASHARAAEPYASAVSDSAFVEMLCGGSAASKRPQQAWRALAHDKIASAGSQTGRLRIVS